MAASIKCICQVKAWFDQYIVSNGLWRFDSLTPMKDAPTNHVMDEFSVHMVSSSHNEIKNCETEIDHNFGVYTSKRHVMDICVNKPLKDYVQKEYQKFKLGIVDNRKMCREDVVNWIEIV